MAYRRLGSGAACALVLTACAAQAQVVVPRIQVPGSDPAPRIQVPGVQPGAGIQVQTLELRDIAFGSADAGAVSIGRVTFRGLRHGADTVRAERVEVQAVVAQIAGRRIELPEAAISGLQLATESFRKMTEGGAGQLDWLALLEQAEIAEIAAPSLADRQPALGVTVNYSRLTLKNLKRGVLESAEFGATQTEQAGPPGQVKVTAGPTVLQALNVAELARFAAGGGSGDAKRLLDRVVVSGLRVITPDATVAIEKLEVAEVDGRAPAAAPAAAPSGGGPRIVLPGREDAEMQRRMAAYAREVARYTRIGRYSLEGIAVKSPGSGDFTIGGVAFVGLSGRGVDLVEVTRVDLTAVAGAVRFDRFALEKFSFGELADWLLEAAAQGREPDFSTAKLAELSPRLGAIRLSGFALETPGGPLELGEFRYETDDPNTALPERITLTLTGAKADLVRWPPNEVRDRLVALGYRQLTAGAQAVLRWLPAERAFALQDTQATVDGLGRVEVGLRFGNIDLSSTAMADPDAFEEAMGKARIEGASVAVANLGFAERFFAAMAREMGTPEATVRMAFAAEAQAQATAAFGPALAPGSLEAITAFFREPRRIVIRAAPRAGAVPPTLAELEQIPPPQLLERMTVAIEIAP